MLRPFVRLRFRLTHAVWACALALALGGTAAFTPLHRLAFAEGGGAAAAWVGGDSALVFSAAFSTFAAWAAFAPAAVSRQPATGALVPGPADAGLASPRVAPLPAALWPLPPPALA